MSQHFMGCIAIDTREQAMNRRLEKLDINVS